MRVRRAALAARSMRARLGPALVLGGLAVTLPVAATAMTAPAPPASAEPPTVIQHARVDLDLLFERAVAASQQATPPLGPSQAAISVVIPPGPGRRVDLGLPGVTATIVADDLVEVVGDVSADTLRSLDVVVEVVDAVA